MPARLPLENKTPADLKRWAQTNAKLGAAVIAARVKAERVRAEVDARAAPIFAKYQFTASKTGKPLATPEDLYLVEDLKDPQVLAYYAEVDAANRAAGWRGAKDTCPALVAEHEVIEAERALLKAGGEFCNVDFDCSYGRLRAQAITLWLQIACAGMLDTAKRSRYA